MRVPRIHRFRAEADPDELFRRLPPRRRFRFARAPAAPQVFGADPVSEVRCPSSGSPREAFATLRERLPRLPPVRRDGLFPGGAVGFLTYECGAFGESLPSRPARPQDPPFLGFAMYDTFAVRHPGDEVEVVSWGLDAAGLFDGRLALRRAGELEERLRHRRPVPGETAAFPHGSPLRASLRRVDHARAVEVLLDRIRRGDLYQGNLTVRLDTDFAGDGVELFERLLRDNPAPESAFLEAEGLTAVSSSPERLLRADGRHVATRPIKGTAPREPDPALDRERAEALLRSPKDRAELLMITDLLRNDLGKVCEYGSVRVPRLRELESYPHVHHLVSTVTGRLRPGLDALDALAALFPCGSITGAPKRAAMEILRELEPVHRGLYTGTVGWIGFDRSAQFNVAIRTGHLRDGVFSFGAGGGIVADSDPDAEWEELRWKARAMCRALGVAEIESRREVRS